jgi:outer membrane protein TolC
MRQVRTLAAAWVGLMACVQAQPVGEGPADAPTRDHPKTPQIDPPPGTILAPDELPIDLGTALRLAGVDNPELQFARERVTEAAAIRQLAAVQLLPDLNAGANFDLHRGPLQQANGNIIRPNRESLYFGLGANAVGSGTVNIPGLNYNLNVSTAWFDYLRSRQLVAQRTAAERATANDVFLRVCLAYCELLRADGRRAIARRNRAEGAELARLTAAYAAVGQGRKADADRAEVELRKRDAELLQTEADTLIASARLAQLLNLDPSTRLKPIDGWVVPAPIVPDPVPLQDLLAIALLQRPELAERRAAIQDAIYALSAAKLLPFSPTVILGFSTGGFGGGSDLVARPGGFIGLDGGRQIGSRFGDFGDRLDFDVVGFWTLRNLGVGNVALVRRADSVLRQARFRELDVLNRIRAEVAEAQARTQAQFAQLDTLEKAIRASTEAFLEDTLRIRGQQGLPIEAVDSLRLLARSRYEYLDAIIGYNQAQFRLYVALGQPPAAALARPVPTNLVPAPGDPPLPPVTPPPTGQAPARPAPDQELPRPQVLPNEGGRQ